MVRTRGWARLEGPGLCFGRWMLLDKEEKDGLSMHQAGPTRPGCSPNLYTQELKRSGWPLRFSMGNRKSWMYGVLAAEKDHTERTRDKSCGEAKIIIATSLRDRVVVEFDGCRRGSRFLKREGT